MKKQRMRSGFIECGSYKEQAPFYLNMNYRACKSGRNEIAFSRIDLLVAAAMLGLLLMLQVSLVANSRPVGSTMVCLSNQRQLTKAWHLFSQDNEDWLVGNLDGGGAMNLSNSNRTWVLGWLNFMGGSPPGANTNLQFLTEYSPLAPYLDRNPRVFKCPNDFSLSGGVSNLPRVRSVAMNTYLGPKMPFTSGYRTFNKMIEIPSLKETFVFMDEHEGSINDPVFQVSMEGFDPKEPQRYRMVDFPASRHAGGATVSFADGRAEVWIWNDARTTPPFWQGNLMPLNVASPGNPDVGRIQSVSTVRR
jgi:prepilin-type processing-associated H-X9-DG protein